MTSDEAPKPARIASHASDNAEPRPVARLIAPAQQNSAQVSLKAQMEACDKEAALIDTLARQLGRLLENEWQALDPDNIHGMRDVTEEQFFEAVRLMATHSRREKYLPRLIEVLRRSRSNPAQA